MKRDLRETRRISIIIATRDRIDLLSRCISSIINKTSYPNFEIIVVDNESKSEEAREYFRHFEHRLLQFNGPFNFSALNNLAVEQSEQPVAPFPEQRRRSDRERMAHRLWRNTSSGQRSVRSARGCFTLTTPCNTRASCSASGYRRARLRGISGRLAGRLAAVADNTQLQLGHRRVSPHTARGLR